MSFGNSRLIPERAQNGCRLWQIPSLVLPLSCSLLLACVLAHARELVAEGRKESNSRHPHCCGSCWEGVWRSRAFAFVLRKSAEEGSLGKDSAEASLLREAWYAVSHSGEWNACEKGIMPLLWLCPDSVPLALQPFTQYRYSPC